MTRVNESKIEAVRRRRDDEMADATTPRRRAALSSWSEGRNKLIIILFSTFTNESK